MPSLGLPVFVWCLLLRLFQCCCYLAEIGRLGSFMICVYLFCFWLHTGGSFEIFPVFVNVFEWCPVLGKLLSCVSNTLSQFVPNSRLFSPFLCEARFLKRFRETVLGFTGNHESRIPSFSFIPVTNALDLGWPLPIAHCFAGSLFCSFVSFCFPPARHCGRVAGIRSLATIAVVIKDTGLFLSPFRVLPMALSCFS